MQGNRSLEKRVRRYKKPPIWLLAVLFEHLDFGIEQEEGLVPTLGFI
jgi:hypothetical protein